MIESIFVILLFALTAFMLIGGIFFMIVGAVGVVRLPDTYCRSHASSKCVTLGIIGLLAALVLYVAAAAQLDVATTATAEIDAEQSISGNTAPGVVALTKALLVVAFVFISAPVGSHMLARAAHFAGVKLTDATLSDDLVEDDQAAEREAL
jgi:multicomponent Na+:H+ antiporter subunit G